jgi:hypothetical protein
LADLGLKFYQARWIPQQCSEQDKADKANLSRDMLQMMTDLRPRQQKYLITGDETWICWDNDHRETLAREREDGLAHAKKTISSQKTR